MGKWHIEEKGFVGHFQIVDENGSHIAVVKEDDDIDSAAMNAHRICIEHNKEVEYEN